MPAIQLYVLSLRPRLARRGGVALVDVARAVDPLVPRLTRAQVREDGRAARVLHVGPDQVLAVVCS